MICHGFRQQQQVCCGFPFRPEQVNNRVFLLTQFIARVCAFLPNDLPRFLAADDNRL
jgi:hypothetical protein